MPTQHDPLRPTPRPAGSRPALRRSLVATVATLAVLAPSLAACGGSEGSSHGSHSSDPGATRTASNGDVYNEADVEFATKMIPHHAQAIEMVTLTVGRDLDPEVQAVADRIRSAQAPEVEQMTDWLTAWGEEVPATSLDHANAHGDGHEGLDDAHDMPGMMTADEMAELEAADDAEFEDLFLELMVAHHEGAIEMAQAEQENGEFADAVGLAEEIESSQEAEIEELKALMGS